MAYVRLIGRFLSLAIWQRPRPGDKRHPRTFFPGLRPSSRNKKAPLCRSSAPLRPPVHPAFSATGSLANESTQPAKQTEAIMTNRRKKFDLYQSVTDQIIEAIETSQAAGFQLPWHRAGASVFMPKNAVTGNAYRGINVVSLWASSEVNRFTTGTWATYKQWQSIGAQVRKGEKSTLGAYYDRFIPKDAEDSDDDQEPEPVWFAKAFRVFNADQVDGYQPEDLPETSLVERVSQADKLVQSTGADIRHGGGRAYYRLSTDRIQMPDEERFKDTETSTATEGYYSTLFHELTHWTGREDRCERDLNNRFGDDAYAMEELVAELGAAFLCAELEISPQPREDHAGYIQHWMEVMKADKKAIFAASARANEATAYLKDK